jgi:hypothetical protein
MYEIVDKCGKNDPCYTGKQARPKPHRIPKHAEKLQVAHELRIGIFPPIPFPTSRTLPHTKTSFR